MRKEKYVLESQEWNITPDVEANEFKPLIDKIIDSNQSWLIYVLKKIRSKISLLLL